jgi:hypothetical protein
MLCRNAGSRSIPPIGRRRGFRESESGGDGGQREGYAGADRRAQPGRFKTFRDLDSKVLEKTGADIAKAQGGKPDFEHDFRRVLDDKQIDAARKHDRARTKFEPMRDVTPVSRLSPVFMSPPAAEAMLHLFLLVPAQR